jgi:hypothetical protein
VNTPVLRGLAIVLAAAVLSFMTVSATAQMALLAPAGTKVGLAFLDQVDTGKTKNGDKVRFIVDANVMVKGHVVIRKGTTLEGTVNAVGHPFPQNSGYANISLLAVPAVDKRTVGLNDVRISAPLFGGDVRVRPGTHTVTTTKKDVVISVK